MPGKRVSCHGSAVVGSGSDFGSLCGTAEVGFSVAPSPILSLLGSPEVQRSTQGTAPVRLGRSHAPTLACLACPRPRARTQASLGRSHITSPSSSTVCLSWFPTLSFTLLRSGPSTGLHIREQDPASSICTRNNAILSCCCADRPSTALVRFDALFWPAFHVPTTQAALGCLLHPSPPAYSPSPR